MEDLSDEPPVVVASERGNGQATRISLPIGHLDTMPGNALLALAGAKTLYVGYQSKGAVEGQFAWLSATTKVSKDGESKQVRVPVIIDAVGTPAPRSKLTPEQLRAAGYRDDSNILLRLQSAPHYLDRMAEVSGTRDISSGVRDKLFLDTAPASRIGFHVATPNDLKRLAAAGHDAPSIGEAHAAIKEAIDDLRKSEQLGRPNIADALTFANHEGIDLTRGKQGLLDTYNREAGQGRRRA